MNKNNRRAAFTLIELLVVIAIIAILAAILFPVFAQAREKALQISGLSNIKEIALARLMYIQDYDELFPANRIYGTYPDGANHITWRAAVMPYIKNEQIWIEPGAPWARNEFDWNPWPGVYQDGAMTYADYQRRYRHCLMNYCDNGNLFGGAVNDATIQFPATTIMNFDTRDFWPDLGTWTIGWNYDSNYGSIGCWYNGGGNWAFVDGHVHWNKIAQTLAPTFLWNPDNNANEWSNWGGDPCASGNNNGPAFVACLEREIPPACR